VTRSSVENFFFNLLFLWIELNEMIEHANKPTTLEQHFNTFRKDIVGIDTTFETPFGIKPLIYADWIASGRLYGPIEDKIKDFVGPFVGNTHSGSSETGQRMTIAYHKAHHIIKKHVNANQDDVIITAGFGMTSVHAKFMRILGLKLPEKFESSVDLPEEDRPVVFISHMEHHSNHTPWLESICDVVIIPPNEDLTINPEYLRKELEHYKNRRIKIGSFTACSNVTGIITPYHELAEVMHEFGGYCFVDFAASAPYVAIDMHPENEKQKLDAIFFSPHKFLGGPGTSGVLIFCKKLYQNRIPDHPGGGTVRWTNPWGQHAYFDDIEIREDGGTPGFIQAIRTALCIRLKEEMGINNIRAREKELVDRAFEVLNDVPEIHVLAKGKKDRLGVISFFVENMHYNLVVRLLNDRFGIQVRGGCSCAGTYGHYLLHVDKERSKMITEQIDRGDFSQKPGWVRLSLHPTMSNQELEYILNAIEEVVRKGEEWALSYEYITSSADFTHKDFNNNIEGKTEALFIL
jgi:selenocysteine lyase/cysteine desulfurase